MDNVFRKQESLRRSIFQAGYDYAKNCFESVLDDMDIPHLEDGRVNPHWLDINGAASEIMGWGDTIPLDKSLFPTFNDGDSIWPYIDDLLADEDVWCLFGMGEEAYIIHAYGTEWDVEIRNPNDGN